MFRDAEQARLPMFGNAPQNKRKTCSTRYNGGGQQTAPAREPVVIVEIYFDPLRQDSESNGNSAQRLPKRVVYFDPPPQDSEQKGNFGDMLLETSYLRRKSGGSSRRQKTKVFARKPYSIWRIPSRQDAE